MLEWVGEVADKLTLPPNLSAVHQVFHVSLLKRYVPYQLHRISYEELELHSNLLYEEEAVKILDHYSKTLCRKEVPWSRCSGSGVTLRRRIGSMRLR